MIDIIRKLKSKHKPLRARWSPGHKKIEERFRQVVEAAPNGMILVNRDGRIVMVNSQAEKMFGYDRKEIIGQLIEILLPHRFRKNHSPYLHNFFREPATRPMGAGRDLSGLHKDGHEFPVEIGLNPIQLEGGMHVLSSIVDITERKHLERMKDQFIGTVSHELRTPLAIISESVGMLADGTMGRMPHEQQEMAEIASRNVERLSRLINDLLELSRLESGKAVVNLQIIQIIPLLEEVVHSFQLSAKKRDIQLEYYLPQALPPIWADPDMLIRVLNNLLDNAMRFARSQITVQVETSSNPKKEAPHETPPVFVRFSVTDDGIGIAPENMKKLFNKFEQIQRPSGGAGYKGTGLGLVISKKIIREHKGDIWAESKVGTGSKFYFTLPLNIKKENLTKNAPLSRQDLSH